MRRLLVKLFLLLLPALGLMASIEWYARSTDRSALRVRRDYFFANHETIKGVFFGPSFTLLSINPAGIDVPSASLALKGSSINVDHLLFKRANEVADLDFVLFDLSIYNLNRKHDREWIETRKLPYYFGIEMDRWSVKHHFYTSLPLHRYLKPKKQRAGRFNKYGFRTLAQFDPNSFRAMGNDPDSIAANKAVRRKLATELSFIPERYEENVELLREIITICRRQGTKVIFYSPPKYYLVNELGRKTDYYDMRQDFLDEHIDERTTFFWNLEEFGEREPRNFANLTHVSRLGAERTTAEINRRLNALFEPTN